MEFYRPRPLPVCKNLCRIDIIQFKTKQDGMEYYNRVLYDEYKIKEYYKPTNEDCWIFEFIKDFT